MGTQSISLSSVGTAILALNPVAKSTTLILTSASSAVGTAQIDISADDPSALTLAGLSSTNITWALASSGAAMVSSNGIFPNGLVYTILSPVAMARINSSANTSLTLTLKALQSVTA